MLTNGQTAKSPSPAVANLVPGPTGRDRRTQPAGAAKQRTRTDRHRDLAVVDPRPAAATSTHDLTWTPAGKREARHLAALLARGEPVKRMTHGTYAKRKGLLVLTSQRVLFMRDRWNGAMAQEFHLASVSSITLHEAGGSSRVEIECMGVVSEIGHVSPAEGSDLVHEAQRILSYVRSPVSAPRPTLVTPDPAQPDPAQPEPAQPEPTRSEPAAIMTPEPAAPAPQVVEPVTPPRPPDDDASLLMSHLRELAQLRRDGFLDDYEFAVAKAKLLN